MDYVIRLVSDKPLDCCGTRYCTWKKDVDFLLSIYPYSRVEAYESEPTTPQSELRELFS